ncbi:MAG TPA: LytTR family DNA-binding domain-containing protein [Methylibium sp.]|uniref:LytR/AlgR family response regulator transcription factor n=1 Tax=Methylibium sp. TaxID=2067992 RepID=UPI002DBA691F|nr:LytTR family DNA-binding domain-containing protein [Methylibium sp.]HEU4460303.1 LytTR family DNA-binding domain-containing protein [Methylibium sp.]
MSERRRPRAIVADDEPLLREHLIAQLASLWPQLEVVAQARNGREAVAAVEAHAPDIAFLDIHMPGLNGIEAARTIGARGMGTALVFVTAYEQYAVQAFERGAIDYLIKPFEPQRLADTVARLRERVAARGTHAAHGGAAIDAVLDELSARLRSLGATKPWLAWIKASVGPNLRLIPVDEVIYLRSDEKYTLVAWTGGDALIRRPIRELIEELDPQRFVQIHRSTIVNLRAVAQVVRGPNETADVQLKARPELLPVSRTYLHVFRQM